MKLPSGDVIPFHLRSTPNDNDTSEVNGLTKGAFNITIPPMADRVAWIFGYAFSYSGSASARQGAVTINNITTGNPAGPYTQFVSDDIRQIVIPVLPPTSAAAGSLNYIMRLEVPIRAWNPALPVQFGTINWSAGSSLGAGTYPAGMIYGVYASYTELPTFPSVG